MGCEEKGRGKIPIDWIEKRQGINRTGVGHGSDMGYHILVVRDVTLANFGLFYPGPLKSLLSKYYY